MEPPGPREMQSISGTESPKSLCDFWGQARGTLLPAFALRASARHPPPLQGATSRRSRSAAFLPGQGRGSPLGEAEGLLRRRMTSPLPTIAYFSMEVGLDSKMPTYSGGLGILSGDTLRSAADLQVPMVGVTLLYRQGYFQQDLDASGQQTEEPVEIL